MYRAHGKASDCNTTCDMSSFIIMERLYNKGLNRSELFFVQPALVGSNVIYRTSGGSWPPVCHPKCHGGVGVAYVVVTSGLVTPPS